MIRTYKRTFHLSSSHFNSEAEYDTFRVARELGRGMSDGDMVEVSVGWWQLMLDCLKNIHGHNFEVTISFVTEGRGDTIIDDERLEKLVRYFDNVNLSVAMWPLRATTENIAAAILERVTQSTIGINAMEVVVRETRDIIATAQPNEDD